MSSSLGAIQTVRYLGTLTHTRMIAICVKDDPGCHVVLMDSEVKAPDMVGKHSVPLAYIAGLMILPRDNISTQLASMFPVMHPVLHFNILDNHADILAINALRVKLFEGIVRIQVPDGLFPVTESIHDCALYLAGDITLDLWMLSLCTHWS